MESSARLLNEHDARLEWLGSLSEYASTGDFDPLSLCADLRDTHETLTPVSHEQRCLALPSSPSSLSSSSSTASLSRASSEASSPTSSVSEFSLSPRQFDHTQLHQVRSGRITGSCHRCKRRPISDVVLVQCSSSECGLKFCRTCLNNHRQLSEQTQASHRAMECPRCLGVCTCKACTRRKQQEASATSNLGSPSFSTLSPAHRTVQIGSTSHEPQVVISLDTYNQLVACWNSHVCGHRYADASRSPDL